MIDADDIQERKKLSKEEVLKIVKADLKAADTLRQEQISLIERWEKEYEGQPYGNEVKGKSTLVSRDIKRQDEWQHASIKDPFVSAVDLIKCTPVTYEDRKAAEQNNLILNYQFTRKFNRYRFMTDVIKLLYSQGTVIVKTSWLYEDEVVEVEEPVFQLNEFTGKSIQIGTKKVKKVKVKENRPDAELCRIEDIYLDPTAKGDISNAQFVIHRYETDLSALHKTRKYKNLDKIARNLRDINSIRTDDYLPEDDTFFSFADVARKKLLVYEYWGFIDIDGDGETEPVVVSWIGDTVIQFSENPLPGQEIPFIIIPGNSTPFKFYGEASVELISDNQKITTAIKRGIIDNMAQSNNGQKGIRNGALDSLNKKRFLSGRNFEFNGSREDFYEGNYNSIPESVFRVLEMVNNETESMLGVKSFSGGISGTQLGPTATSARGVLDSVAIRRLDIVRNISENLIKPLIRKWMTYNAEFLEEKEIVRITNDDFIEINRDDLSGKIDIEIEVTTAEDNSAKAQELAFLIQTLGQDSDLQIRNLLMSQFAKLHRMPDLAKMLENYQPQEDPLMRRKLELEVAKLEAEIAERRTRAQENLVDMELKGAKAENERAKSAITQSEADLKDLEFVRQAEGKPFEEKMLERAADFESQKMMRNIDK